MEKKELYYHHVMLWDEIVHSKDVFLEHGHTVKNYFFKKYCESNNLYSNGFQCFLCIAYYLSDCEGCPLQSCLDNSLYERWMKSISTNNSEDFLLLSRMIRDSVFKPSRQKTYNLVHHLRFWNIILSQKEDFFNLGITYKSYLFKKYFSENNLVEDAKGISNNFCFLCGVECSECFLLYSCHYQSGSYYDWKKSIKIRNADLFKYSATAIKDCVFK